MGKPARKLKIITRASRLALNQVAEVLALLPDPSRFIVQSRKSWGDKHHEVSLAADPPADIFTRELDQALLRGQADLAVHSAKDLPYPLPEGLEVIALLPARDQDDCLVSRGKLPLSRLPKASRVGSSSVLRQAQVKSLRPDLQPVDIRGTIEERLAKIASREVDAVIVAACALQRLGRSGEIAEMLPFQTHPLQGHLAVTARYGKEELKEIFSGMDIRRGFGTVYLTGFGPGDPGLLTVKAERLLKTADVIVHDALINPTVLAAYPGEKINAGKRKGRHTLSQDAIQALLFEKARCGQKVVRLKGGDPFIFGRGGEELDYLKARLIPVEVVPGVTSALAAAAYAELPLTRRGVAASVAFCTGHPVNKITVPQADTLVYYMAADTLAEVARKIIAGGWDPGTPAAGITKATCPGQRVAFFTLADLAEKGHKSVRLESPLLLIVGKAVKNGRTKNWFSIRKKILFTGTRPEHFQDHGEIVHQPLIAIEPLPEYREADEVLRRLQHFDWVVFTSQHTVRFFFDRLASLGWDSRALHGLRIASVGAETTRALAQKGLSPDLQPRVESAQGLIKVFSEFLTRPAAMLLPHSDLAPRRLEQGLTRLGHRPVPVVLYRTIPATPVTWDWDGIDQIYFTSPSGVKNFKHLHRKIPGNVHCAAIGPETERALRYAKIQKI